MGCPSEWATMAFDMTSDIAFAGAAEQARLLADGAITAPELLDTIWTGSTG